MVCRVAWSCACWGALCRHYCSALLSATKHTILNICKEAVEQQLHIWHAHAAATLIVLLGAPWCCVAAAWPLLQVLWIPEFFKARGAHTASLYAETFAVAAANLPGKG